MKTPIRIDFVSDVSCPWCVIGLKSLEDALVRLDGQVTVDVHFQPFELNPKMPSEGQDIREHLIKKYGLSPAQYEQSSEAMRARGEQLGFIFRMDKRNRVYNTFDAHRLLHWAELEGRQMELKRALFQAYFTDGKDPSSHEILVSLAEQSGLDANRAREILSSNEYAQEVRERERFYIEQGINAVPSVIINQSHLMRGAQPADMYAKALESTAAE